MYHELKIKLMCFIKLNVNLTLNTRTQYFMKIKYPNAYIEMENRYLYMTIYVDLTVRK